MQRLLNFLKRLSMRQVELVQFRSAYYDGERHTTIEYKWSWQSEWTAIPTVYAGPRKRAPWMVKFEDEIRQRDERARA